MHPDGGGVEETVTVRDDDFMPLYSAYSVSVPDDVNFTEKVAVPVVSVVAVPIVPALSFNDTDAPVTGLLFSKTATV